MLPQVIMYKEKPSLRSLKAMELTFPGFIAVTSSKEQIAHCQSVYHECETINYCLKENICQSITSCAIK